MAANCKGPEHIVNLRTAYREYREYRQPGVTRDGCVAAGVSLHIPSQIVLKPKPLVSIPLIIMLELMS